ncbi:amidase [Devosia sp. 2618]|uniref:amidase n=1 Tax=Devosia sp. 2618 TaxID=3156454 RepID=UPI00339969B1
MSTIVPLSIRKAGEQLRARSLSATQLVTQAIATADRLDRELNVFAARTDSTRLLEITGQIDRRLDAGDEVGPLAGIPLTIKDIFGTHDLPTTASSKVLAGHQTGVDAVAVSRLRSAGGVVMGKSQTHEFAYGPTTNNDYAGPSRNPWNPNHVPGGSSGGSAIAIATGICMGATGSDTGGSIRTPSALCGISGLKPTYGLVSKRGALSLAWSLDTAGPMSRSVDDLAFLLEAMAGFDAEDPGSVKVTLPRYSEVVSQSPERLRIGVPAHYYLEGVDEEVRAAFESSLDLLRALGHSIETMVLPHLKYALGAELAILAAEASAYHRDRMRARADDFSSNVRRELDAGMSVLATDYLLGQRVRRLICKDFAEVFTKVDMLVTPTVPIVAPGIGESTVTINGVKVQALDALWRNVFPTNLSGSPTLCLPNGFSGSRLPISLQLIGRNFDEATLLRLGVQLQKYTDWHQRTPPGA